MKKIFSLTILLSVVLFSCDSIIPPQKQIAKDWQTSSLVFKTDVKDFTISKSSLGINLNIKSNGTYQYSTTNGTEEGSWKIINNDKQLELVDAQKVKNVFDIVSLDKTHLTISWAKLNLTLQKPSAQEAELKTLYEDLLSFSKLYADYVKAKPTWIQLYVNYVPK